MDGAGVVGHRVPELAKSKRQSSIPLWSPAPYPQSGGVLPSRRRGKFQGAPGQALILARGCRRERMQFLRIGTRCYALHSRLVAASTRTGGHEIGDLVNSDIDSGDCLARSGMIFSQSCKNTVDAWSYWRYARPNSSSGEFSMSEGMWMRALFASPYTSFRISDAMTDPAWSPAYRNDELVNHCRMRHSAHTSFASVRASSHNPFEACALLRFTRTSIGFEGLRDNSDVYRAVACRAPTAECRVPVRILSCS